MSNLVEPHGALLHLRGFTCMAVSSAAPLPPSEGPSAVEGVDAAATREAAQEEAAARVLREIVGIDRRRSGAGHRAEGGRGGGRGGRAARQRRAPPPLFARSPRGSPSAQRSLPAVAAVAEVAAAAAGSEVMQAVAAMAERVAAAERELLAMEGAAAEAAAAEHFAESGLATARLEREAGKGDRRGSRYYSLLKEQWVEMKDKGVEGEAGGTELGGM